MSYTRRSLQVLAFLATLIVGATSMAVIVTQTTWFKEWLRGFIVRQAEDYVNGRLSIGRLDGNLFFGVDLGDVDITMNGKTVVDVDDVTLDYNAFTLIGGDIVLDEIRLTRPVLRLERDARGWNLAHLIRARTPDPDEPKTRRTLEIGELAISDGTLHLEPEAVGTSGIAVPARIEKLDASVGITTNAEELTIDIDRVSLRAAEPDIGINDISGVVRRTRDELHLENVSIRTEESALHLHGSIENIEGGSRSIDLEASSDTLALGEIARLVPALRGYALQPSFDVTARGPVDRMAVDLTLHDARLGEVQADMTVDADAPGLRASGTARVDRFNVRALTRGQTAAAERLTSDIAGTARFDLALPENEAPIRGSYAVRLDHVRIAGYDARNVVAEGRVDGATVRVYARGDAYCARATATGVVRAGAPFALDLRGRAENVDLRNLPAGVTENVPRAESHLQFDYTLNARGGGWQGTAEFDRSMLVGATIGAGTTGTFSFGAGAPTYSAKGEIAHLDVQQLGREFQIQALAQDRYRSAVSGSFDVTGSGGGRYPLMLDATGTLVDSTLFGAMFPRMRVNASFSDGNARIKTTGSFADLDPSVVTGNARLAGALTGSIDAETTLQGYADGVTVDSVDTTGRIELGPSTVGELAIDSAVVDGRYRNREGQLTQLQIEGADLSVTGGGAIALNDTGASNLRLHAETPALERVGDLLGRPLKGSAIVDATVTGNARELEAAGTLTGSNIGYGDSEALSLTSTFAATVPDLDVERARIEASSSATFLEIAGQRINTLTADTTYSQSNLDFKAVAQEGRRELAAGGSVILHPDHQEIHVNDLALRSEQIEWRTPPGVSAAIRYAGDRIEVKNLELMNADQHIAASGVIGSNREALRVRVQNVDVAQLDTLLFGDGRLAGRLTGDADVSGPPSALRVSSNLALTNGAFGDYMFQSLRGIVDYTPTGMALDVRLEQTPTEWITAKGLAPITLFQPTPAGVEVHDAERMGGVVDVQIETSQIGLGFIQGFTPYVTNVTGTVQANVRITGTGYDPHPEGTIDIRGGAFAIPELGTSYTGLDTRVELQPELLIVREFKILDSRGFPMTVGGTLAVHEREVGAVDITLQSEDFEVIDNTLADLKLDTQLRLTGELRKPRLEGVVGVENGTIHLAELIEQTTADPYATDGADAGRVGADDAARATPPGSPEARTPARGEPPATAQAPEAEPPNLFRALALDITLRVPSNLVLRGNDLRPANAPIDVGDMNVTVGGDVQVRKEAGDDLHLIGEVNTVRGTYTFQGRRFEILRDGQIRFAGVDELNPTIDIRARRVISGVETFVRVRGSMKQPELTFSSNPPLDQADILSLIVFNQPINELGEGQQVSLAERASALAGGYLATGLSRSISNALELDEFEIQAGERGFGPTLSVGEQVGEHFFFRVRQGFGDAQATELILEYQIGDFLRVQGTAAQTASTQRVTFRRVERAGIDLIFFFSY